MSVVCNKLTKSWTPAAFLFIALANTSWRNLPLTWQWWPWRWRPASQRSSCQTSSQTEEHISSSWHRNRTFSHSANLDVNHAGPKFRTAGSIRIIFCVPAHRKPCWSLNGKKHFAALESRMCVHWGVEENQRQCVPPEEHVAGQANSWRVSVLMGKNLILLCNTSEDSMKKWTSRCAELMCQCRAECNRNMPDRRRKCRYLRCATIRCVRICFG